MKEFVAMVKKEPDKYNVSTPPVGTTPQLQAEVLKLREGMQQMATIVYAGGGDALKALLSNTVQLSSGVLAPAHPQIKAGAIKGLAVTGEKRWHDLPDIPTMIESGYPDFVFDTYTALMAPARIPPEAVAFLEKQALTALSKPELRTKLTDAGFDVTARTGEGHMARIRKEVPMFKKIIADAGIKLSS
jgi:tripartite-type tricarboxylate transporter receptor subunit TctC